MAAVTRIKGEGNFFANLIDAILYTAGINLDPHILTYPTRWDWQASGFGGL
jgi:hypothetical protein